MGRLRAWTAIMVTVLGSGCMQGPPLMSQRMENPLFVAQGHGSESYRLVFQRVSQVVNEYFPLADSNRYDGHVESEYRVSAGWLDILDPPPYNSYEQWESTLQTVRRKCLVLITPAESGGYHVDVKVFKELENLPQPAHASAGKASFRHENPLERQFDVIDDTTVSRGWIPIGRDLAFEQLILSRIKATI
jgi:hypothetical protein